MGRKKFTANFINLQKCIKDDVLNVDTLIVISENGPDKCNVLKDIHKHLSTDKNNNCNIVLNGVKCVRLYNESACADAAHMSANM